MARDAQTVTIGTDGGVVDIVPLQRDPRSPIAPFQLVSFRGAVFLDGSGAGDTADCRITLPLPGNNVYQLQAFNAVADIDSYDVGQLELYYAAKTGEFAAGVQLDFPLIKSQTNQVYLTPSVSYALGHTYEKLVTGGPDPVGMYGGELNSPGKLIFGGTAVGGTDPVLWLSGGGSTNVSNGTLRIAINFLAFTLEQWQHSMLYTGLMSR